MPYFSHVYKGTFFFDRLPKADLYTIAVTANSQLNHKYLFFSPYKYMQVLTRTKDKVKAQ